MGLESLQIIFDSPNTVFSPGQFITGRVLILASNSEKIKSVKLTFKGKATVSWNENQQRKNENDETENSSVKYHAEETYFKNKTNLAGGGGTLHLAVGEHAYPFNFLIPNETPSTITNELGRVQYEAKVKIELPWGKPKVTKKYLEVMSMIDLNNDASLREPKKEEIEKFYCCCWCKSGPMTMVVGVPCSGFVRGQIIPITIEIDNTSNVDISNINVKLQKTLKFQAKYPFEKFRTLSYVIAVLDLQGVEKHASKTDIYEMTVPDSLTLNDLRRCGIISENYVLNVVAHTSGMYTKSEINMKLTMGHIPLSGLQDAPNYGGPIQLLDQTNLATVPLHANSIQPIGFIEPAPVPGLAYSVPQKLTFPAQTPVRYPDLNKPQTLQNSQSQIPYPSNPAVNPYSHSYSPTPGVTSSTPTASPF